MISPNPCEWCGGEIEVDKPYRIPIRRFCSRACANAWKVGRPHPVSPKPRVCEICGEMFTPRGGAPKWCKECVPNGKAYEMYRNYRLSWAEYQRMVDEQDGKCALCDEPATVIDHDHETGQVRALLCHGCNSRLAGFEREQEWQERARLYLEVYG